VLLAPGGLFGGTDPDDPHERMASASVRVGFGRASFGEALEVFDGWLEAAAFGKDA
jgi:hypothetical protein